MLRKPLPKWDLFRIKYNCEPSSNRYICLSMHTLYLSVYVFICTWFFVCLSRWRALEQFDWVCRRRNEISRSFVAESTTKRIYNQLQISQLKREWRCNLKQQSAKTRFKVNIINTLQVGGESRKRKKKTKMGECIFLTYSSY